MHFLQVIYSETFGKILAVLEYRGNFPVQVVVLVLTYVGTKSLHTLWQHGDQLLLLLLPRNHEELQVVIIPNEGMVILQMAQISEEKHDAASQDHLIMAIMRIPELQKLKAEIHITSRLQKAKAKAKTAPLHWQMQALYSPTIIC